jgi:hypothetical protein
MRVRPYGTVAIYCSVRSELSDHARGNFQTCSTSKSVSCIYSTDLLNAYSIVSRGSQSALEPDMNECNEECVSLGARRRDGSFLGKEGQTEKRATRKSRKQRGEQKVCIRKPERYVKDCILYEQEEELYWQEADVFFQEWENMEADNDARWEQEKKRNGTTSVSIRSECPRCDSSSMRPNAGIH